jgi:hypothetical protein
MKNEECSMKGGGRVPALVLHSSFLILNSIVGGSYDQP